MIVGLVLFVLGLAASWFGYRRRTANVFRYVVYERGLAEFKGSQFQSMRWDEIQSVWRKVMTVRQAGESLGEGIEVQSMRLQDQGGQEMHIAGQAPLGKIVEEQVYPRLWKQLSAGMAAGGTAHFGSASMNQAGISHGGTVVPWEWVTGISMPGNVRVETDREIYDWKTAPRKEIPNLPVFVKALREIGAIEICR